MRWVKITAWLNLAANILIIATGGTVRLTASGLGCDTWPMCTEDSWVPTAEDGIHGLIEFGNRTLTGLLALLAVLALVAVWRRARARRDLWAHAWIILGGVAVQGVVGGIVVLTQLEMSTVGLHYLISAVMVGVCASFVVRSHQDGSPRERAVPLWLLILTHLSSLALAGVVIGGVITTGSGPHSGDDEVIRDSAAWEVLVHVHAWFGYVLLGLLVAVLAGAWASRSWPTLRASAWVIGVVVVQIVVGILQARLGIPPLLVGIHMVLAAVTVAVGVLLVSSLKAPAVRE